jgi:hypothetical protein
MKLAAHAVLAVAVMALLVTVLPSSAKAVDEQAEIVQIAYAHIGAKFKLGANGPTKFDCSGFVWFTFNTAGLGDRIGGKPLRAKQFQKYFRERGLTFKDPKEARVGDLVFYGSPAKHSGIVTRIDNKGRPRVTSALTTGVRETKYNSLDVRFDSFARVGLGNSPDPTPSPTPTPTPEPTATPEPTPTATPDPTPTAEPTSAPSSVAP